jgi:hypothetical protein
MSKLLASRNYFREKIGLSQLPSSESNADKVHEEDDAASDAEAAKNEHSMIIILKNARNKYKERGLVGSIDISGSVGIFTTSISCEIDAEEDEKGDDVVLSITDTEDIDSLRAREKLVLSYLDGVLKKLERRAKAYQTLPFADSLTLSNGVYICDPIFGTFTFSISMTASVLSLINEINQRAKVEAP